MNKILNNHKIQMDVINESIEAKQMAYDEMIELEIDDAIEAKHEAREKAFIQFNEETVEGGLN